MAAVKFLPFRVQIFIYFAVFIIIVFSFISCFVGLILIITIDATRSSSTSICVRHFMWPEIIAFICYVIISQKERTKKKKKKRIEMKLVCRVLRVFHIQNQVIHRPRTRARLFFDSVFVVFILFSISKKKKKYTQR